MAASKMAVGLRYTPGFALHTSQERMFDEGMDFLIPMGDCRTVFCLESIVMCPNVLNFM